MPQMKPIYWLYMFIIFIITISIYLMLNYFINVYTYNLKLNNFKKKLIIKNWKW